MKGNSQGVLGADRCQHFLVTDQKNTDAKIERKYVFNLNLYTCGDVMSLENYTLLLSNCQTLLDLMYTDSTVEYGRRVIIHCYWWLYFYLLCCGLII
jgi:hypothetical protein